MATKRTKNKDGYYEIRRKVPPYKDKNGKIQTYKKFYGKTVREAEEKFQKFKAGTDQAPAFFDDLMDSFIRDTFLPDPKFKASTKQRYIDAYRSNLEGQPVAKKNIKDITYRDLQEAYSAMTCKPSGVRNCHKLLRLFYNLMIQQRIVDVNPTDGLTVPKPDKRVEEIITFTDEELSKVKAYLSRSDLPYYEQQRVDRYRLIILIALYTGMRTSEILALTYDDISADSITVNKQVVSRPVFKDGRTAGHELVIDDTKTDNAVRTVPIGEELYKVFTEHKKLHKKEMLKYGYRTNQVFTTQKGNLIDKRSLRHSIDKIHRDAGVPCYGLHTYRRTFGTKLAASGTPIQVLSDLLGHADINVTAKYYVGIASDEKIKAVATLY